MRSRPARNLTAALNMNSAYVAEVRRVLQRLLRQGQGTGRKTYLITSAGRGEGKSTTCALMAVVAARVFQKKVIAVDGDFLRPTLHRLLGISHHPGLCEVLQQRTTLDAVIRATSHPNLFAISSGSMQGSVAEAYDDASFRRVVEQLRADFDFVFVDSAPVVPVVEPLLMAEHLDAILLVTMAGHTPLNILRRMREILAPVSTRIAGLILNNASACLPYYYDYRYYGYEPATHRRIRRRSDGASTSSSSDTKAERHKGA